jgi:hypothetical protein
MIIKMMKNIHLATLFIIHVQHLEGFGLNIFSPSFSLSEFIPISLLDYSDQVVNHRNV